MRLVLMGPPGAGKGTQAKRLVDRFGMVHLSSGDILRAVRNGGSGLGRQLKSYMDAGELVPDETVVEIMAKAISEAPAGRGLLLDGFPRTLPQAEALDRQLAESRRPLQAVLVIEAPDELLVERITGRRSCPACGKVFHVKSLPPPPDGRCDRCGAELVQRGDDAEPVVRERLAAYLKQTAPVIDYYANSGRWVIRTDGSAPPDEVTERIAAALEKLGSKA